MFRSELSGHHEDQQLCLMVFPPQVTAGETAIAQIEPADPRQRRPPGADSPWRLVCDNTPLGTAGSYDRGVSFRFEEPGRKRLLAVAARVGLGQSILASADLFVHSQIEDEIDSIFAQLDQLGPFNTKRWFKDVADRHHDDAYKERLDLALGRHLGSPLDMALETAFTLQLMLHEPALRRVAAKFFHGGGDVIEDVLQEAKKGAWRSLHTFRAGSRFGPWIHKALLHACTDAKRRLPLTPGDVGHQAMCRDGAIDAIDARDAVVELTRNLDPIDVEILSLRHGQDMGYIDIARVLKIQPGRPDATRVTTIRRRIERLERHLRAARGYHSGTNDAGGMA